MRARVFGQMRKTNVIQRARVCYATCSRQGIINRGDKSCGRGKNAAAAAAATAAAGSAGRS